MDSLIGGVLRNPTAARTAALTGVVVLGFFVLAFDQGQVLSAVMGNVAYQQNWLHEFFHDVRHTGAFQCH